LCAAPPAVLAPLGAKSRGTLGSSGIALSRGRLQRRSASDHQGRPVSSQLPRIPASEWHVRIQCGGHDLILFLSERLRAQYILDNLFSICAARLRALLLALRHVCHLPPSRERISFQARRPTFALAIDPPSLRVRKIAQPFPNLVPQSWRNVEKATVIDR